LNRFAAPFGQRQVADEVIGFFRRGFGCFRHRIQKVSGLRFQDSRFKWRISRVPGIESVPGAWRQFLYTPW
jgi:hypothetical protein